MPSDQWNIDFIYPTKKDTASWFFDNEDPTHDARFYIGSGVDGITKTGSYWKCNSNDQVRLNAQTPKTVNMDNSLGGCNMNYADASARGHAGMSDAWRDIEMTCLFNLTTFSPSDGRVILKGPTFRHSSEPCCSGHAYGIRFYLQNPCKVQFLKEMYHSHYGDGRPDDPATTKFGSLADGTDKIVKFVRYNITENNIKGVKLEAYIDFNGDGKDFVKVLETKDLGGWNDGGDTCKGKVDQILDWGSGWMQYRWDASSTNIKFKNWSVRHIDPEANFDTVPTDPEDTRFDVTRLVFPLVLKFDVNALRVNPCGVTGGGGGGGAPLNPQYEIAIGSANELSDVSANDNRKRAVIKIDGTCSPLYNFKPSSCEFALRKHNTPAAASISAKIWRKPNTVIYTSPTTYTDASLTSSFVYKAFDFSSNTRFLQVGDLLGVEYINADGTNYVEFSYVSDIGGNCTTQSQYEGTAWDDNARELSCKIF